MATSDLNDFYTLKRVTDELGGLVELSTSIAKLQTLFKSFIELCEGLVSQKRQRTIPANVEAEFQTPQAPQVPLATSQAPDCAPNMTVLANTGDSCGLSQPSSAPFVTPENELTLTSGGTSGGATSGLNPGWELFDVQPTLDWLGADFSFFDHEQYQQW